MTDRASFLKYSRERRREYVQEHIERHPRKTYRGIAKDFGMSAKALSKCLLNPGRKHLRNYVLEFRIKNYLLSHHGQTCKESLRRYLRVSPRDLQNSLKDAGICLLPKSWYSESRVLKEYNSGYLPAEISRKLDMNLNYICTLLTRLGKDYKADQELRLKEKVTESSKKGNCSSALLAKDLGVSESWAYRLKVRFGMQNRGRGSEKEYRPKREKLLRKGCSQRRVAQIEGVTQTAIYSYLAIRPKLKKAWEKANKKKNRQIKS